MPPHPLDPRWASPPLLNPQLVQPCQWAPFPPAGQTQSLGWTQVLHQSTRRYIHRLHLPTLDGAQTRFVSWLLWSLAGTSMNLREIARKKTHNLFQVECDGVCIDEYDWLVWYVHVLFATQLSEANRYPSVKLSVQPCFIFTLKTDWKQHFTAEPKLQEVSMESLEFRVCFRAMNASCMVQAFCLCANWSQVQKPKAGTWKVLSERSPRFRKASSKLTTTWTHDFCEVLKQK